MLRALLQLALLTIWLLAVLTPAKAADEAFIRQLETNAVQLQIDLRKLTLLPRNTSTREAVQADRASLSEFRVKAKEAGQKVDGPLADVSKQIEELGPLPEPGKNEPQTIAQKRSLLTGQLDRLQGLRKQFDLSLIHI